MDLILSLVLVLVAGVIGFAFGRNSAPDQKKMSDMENLILEKDDQLKSYQNKVTTHFDKSAQLFDKVTQDYQSLYQHMASSSQELIGAQPFKPALENKGTELPPKTSEEPEPSLADTFNNESLYNAHDYRNQEQQQANKENTASDNGSADIIELKQAKDELDEKEKKERPLDYAIKKEGEINHNSLEIKPKSS